MKPFAQSLILYLLFLTGLSTAQENLYYFYHPEIDYGSELIFNPLSLLVSGSYDILRNGTETRDVFDQPYRNGIKNVWKNLTHPASNVREYGTRVFFSNEVFNLKFDPQCSQFMANYSLHLLGNGMQYAKLAEWYEEYGYPHPRILSLATTLSYQYMNEVLENGAFTGANVDPISDMLIFNPIGFTLFSTAWGKHFFSHTVPLYDWSPLAYYNPANRELLNTGQQYATKIRFKSSHYAFFAYWGVQTVFGASYRLDDERSLSLGIGSCVYNVRQLRQGKGSARKMIPETVPAIGLFYDANNSLLSSLYISGEHLQHVRLDVFPGLITIHNCKPGFFAGYGEWDKLQFGVTLAWLPVGVVGNLR